MGANCCVAARSKPMPNRITCEVSSYRNIRHSPSWSFRWDNRTHIEDIMDNPPWLPHYNSGDSGFESKNAADTEAEGLSDIGSPLYAHEAPNWVKKVDIAGSSKSIPTVSGYYLMVKTHLQCLRSACSQYNDNRTCACTTSYDQSTRSNSSPEDKGFIKPSSTTIASYTKPSVSLPSTPSFKAVDPSSSRKCSSLQFEPSSFKKARHSPGNQLTRQVSDSRNNLSACGSYGGSSDGWSMRTFSELVAASASSRRERWSFDSENTSSFNSVTMTRSSPPNVDPRTCRVCLRPLKEKSPWCVQKIVSTNELSVAAVLVCGHIYHAECLENITSEIDRYDPPCPLCTNGEKSNTRTKNKISRRAVADIDVNEFKLGGKSRSVGPSSSAKGSFGRPFLRRHFSIGPRPPPVRNSEFEGEITRKKKGFWGRYRRD